MNSSSFYIQCLRSELSARCERNPRYSIRAFGRALGLEPSALSQILRGKRVPTAKTAERIARGLALAPHDLRRFYESLEETTKGKSVRQFAALATTKTPESSREISQDEFSLISEWQHLAILALTHDANFNSDPRWIAGALGIAPAVARVSVDRLLSLGLLRKKGAKVVATDKKMAVADPSKTTAALRSYQRKILEMAIASLEEDAIEERSMTGTTLSADPRKLSAAKTMIRDFQRELADFLETGTERVVFQLGISLYPLQKNRRRSPQ